MQKTKHFWVFERTGQSGRNNLKGVKSSRRTSFISPLNGEDDFLTWREPHVLLPLSLAVEMSDVVVIFMPLSPFHILHVVLISTICFGFHATLSHFPCIPFPGFSVPSQAAGSFQSNLLHYQDRESGTLIKEQDGEGIRGGKDRLSRAWGLTGEFVGEGRVGEGYWGREEKCGCD